MAIVTLAVFRAESQTAHERISVGLYAWEVEGESQLVDIFINIESHISSTRYCLYGGIWANCSNEAAEDKDDFQLTGNRLGSIQVWAEMKLLHSTACWTIP